MFQRELENRQRKFERESKARISVDRAKALKLKREREAAKRLEEKANEEARLRRLAEEAAREAEEQRQDSVREANRGIFMEEMLAATPLPDAVAIGKGIKRGADKILLPPSIGNMLMDQGASKNGAMLFEITVPSGRSTHAGLLEFSAAEGFIGLPRKVVQSLWGPEGECLGSVKVAYKRLDPGGYVRFQPVRYGFHEAVGENMRDVLEQALMRHCTLTEGDYLELHHQSLLHELKVVELSPSPAASIIDTDLEADVTPSEEVEAAVLAEQEAVRLRQEERNRMEELIRQQEEERRREEMEKLEKQEREQLERQQIVKQKAEALPPEVPENTPEPTILCLFRWSNGSRDQRRFKLEDPVSQVFDFVDSKGGGGHWPGTYKLVTRFPRRVLLSSPSSLAEVGLTGTEEIFFLEAVSDTSEA